MRKRKRGPNVHVSYITNYNFQSYIQRKINAYLQINFCVSKYNFFICTKRFKRMNYFAFIIDIDNVNFISNSRISYIDIYSNFLFVSSKQIYFLFSLDIASKAWRQEHLAKSVPSYHHFFFFITRLFCQSNCAQTQFSSLPHIA